MPSFSSSPDVFAMIFVFKCYRLSPNSQYETDYREIDDDIASVNEDVLPAFSRASSTAEYGLSFGPNLVPTSAPFSNSNFTNLPA